MTYGFIRNALAGILGVEEGEITPDTPLWRAMDAVSFAKLVMACEAEFRVAIPDESAVQFATVHDLIRFIADRVADGVGVYRAPGDSAREAWYYD